MTNPKRRIVPAVVAGALGMGACMAWAAEPSSTMDSVMQDASARSHMLAPAPAAHPFTIGQGDFSLSIMPGMQFRGVANIGDERKGGDNDIQTGFEITRARLELEGKAFSPKLRFKAGWEAGDISGGVTLLDAMAMYDVADNMTIKAGQFKDLVTHEGLVAWQDGLAVERSVANEVLGTPTAASGRVQGVSLIVKPSDQINVEVALHDGLGSANTSFADAGAYWGISARGEFKVMGQWKDYADMTARKTMENLLVVGAGIDFTEVPGARVAKVAVDAQWEMQKLGVYGAVLANWADPTAGSNVLSWGFMAQAGYALTDDLEVFGRLGLVKIDEDILPPGAEDTILEITLGVNYYLLNAGNGAKVTADVAILPNGAPSAPYHNLIGANDELEIAVRLQLQLRP